MSCQDKDKVDTIFYSIKSGDSTVFLIDANTGEITLNRGKNAITNLPMQGNANPCTK